MKTTTHKVPELELVSVLYRGNDETIETELRRLAQIVGLDFQSVSESDRTVDGVLTFQSHGTAPLMVTARFHDMFASYFARGIAKFHIREDSADVMALMSSVGATVRGTVVGLAGAHGGAGVSSLAAWLSRLASSEGNPVALADLNRASDSWQMLLGSACEGRSRLDVGHVRGTLLPGKLADSLANWHGVHVLASNEGDHAKFPRSCSGIISALAQVHAWTFLDMGVMGTDWDSQRDWLRWCDVLVLVTGPSVANVDACRIKNQEIGAQVRPIIVANTVKSHLEADHVAASLEYGDVYGVRRMRSMRADCDHGLVPGDRAKSKTGKDITRLWTVIKESVAS
ncbi:hypothetical protein [Arcanobacterium phocae]|uniref:hypothetical protein n=1 Tax=Arcanobacterium phocae TaxID=131112 RepID=UPI001C0EFD0E|nr:hypothetical protein [Arcanobacterium phocae]